jgi:ATP-dependent DNA ligase
MTDRDKPKYRKKGLSSPTWGSSVTNHELLNREVIGGYTPDNPFDALIVGYYEGERLLYAAKVRSGFVPQVRREVASRFKGLEIDTCSFANLPERKRTQWALTKEEMKNCVWLNPELVAHVEFTEWTPDGYLRHSKFVGLINMKAMYFATSVDRLTGEGGRAIWNTSHWTFIRSTPGHE